MKKVVSTFLAIVIISVLALSATALEPMANNVSNIDTDYINGTFTLPQKRGSKEVMVRIHRLEAWTMFQRINEERRNEGLYPYEWDDKLYEAALQRAAELTQDFSHTRTDGSKWSTVSEYAKAENIGWNSPDGEAMIDKWMNSKSHKDNIMDEKNGYKTIGIACIDTSNGPYYVQLFGTKESRGTSTADQSLNQLPGGSPTIHAEDGSAVTVGVGIGTEANAEVLLRELTKATGVARVISKNIDAISPTVLAEVNTWATKNEREVRLSFDTIEKDTGTVHGRISFNPFLFASQKSLLQLGVRSESTAITTTKNYLKKYFTNKIVIIALDQTGGLIAPVDVAVKIDLSDMDINNLKFYSYKDNTYILRSNVDYRIDENNYIYFSTSDEMTLITDKALKK